MHKQYQPIFTKGIYYRKLPFVFLEHIKHAIQRGGQGGI